MLYHIFYLSTLGVIQLSFGSPNGGRKFRSLGRVENNENSFRCPGEGFYADPRECRTFYRCVDWTSNDFSRDYMEPILTAFRFECGEGTVFDPDYNVCNHPRDTRRAECGGRQSGGNGSGGYPPVTNENENSQYYPPVQGGTGGYPSNSNNNNNNYQPPSTNNPDNSENKNGNQMTSNGSVESNQQPLDPAQDCPGSGFFPVKNDCQKFIQCVDNGNGGYTKYKFSCGPGTVWDPSTGVCNFPSAVPGCGKSVGQGGSPEQGGYPGQVGSQGQGGYPGMGGSPGQGGYPGQVGSQGQGGYPGMGGSPGQGGYPGMGGSPGQGGYPGQVGSQGQGGYPGMGGSPGQGGYPGTGGSEGQGGYPGQGNASEEGNSQCTSSGFYGVPGNCKKFIRCVENGNGGYMKYEFECGTGTAWDPELKTCNYASLTKSCKNSNSSEAPDNQTEMPGQWGYPGSGEMTEQEKFPTPSEAPESGYPESEGMVGQEYPQQGGYPKPSGYPEQGGYPKPGGYPEQGGYPKPGGYPEQGGYPKPGGYPEQGGYPKPGGYPEQGGYPQPTYPSEGNPQNPAAGNPSQCQNEGFYPVKGSCRQFFRCVNDGNNKYIRYDFQCGEGTVWDPEISACNHPWAVTRNDVDCSSSSNNQNNQSWSQTTTLAPVTSPHSETTSSYYTSSTSANQGQYNTATTTSSSQNQLQTTLTTQTQPQGSQTTSTQQSIQTSNQPTGSSTTEQGYTKPMQPQEKPTTKPSKPEMISGYENPSKPPPGSSSCDGNKVPSEIKCEKDGFYPDPSDCRKFYRCADWDNGKGERFSVYYFECGKGTIWDPALQTCNHEKSVYPPRNCPNPSNESSVTPSTEQTTTKTDTSQPSSMSTSTTPTTTISSQNPTSTQTVSTSTSVTEQPTSTSTLEASETPTSPTTESDNSESTKQTDSTTNPTDTTESSIANASTDSASPSVTESTDSTSPSNTESTDTTSPVNTESTDSSSQPNTESTDVTSPQSSEPTESTTPVSNTEPTDVTSSSSVFPTDSTTVPDSEMTTEKPTESSTFSTTQPGSSEQTESSESSTPQEMSTSKPSDSSNCPQLSDGQSLFVCPTGFRRHPKDCNSFYQCTVSKDTGEINVMTLSCKNNTLYDERKIQCLPPEETEVCENPMPGRRFYRRTEEYSSSVVYVSPYKKLCPAEGLFPYDEDCTRFYKCKKNKSGKIQGYMYQCPGGYSFYDVTQKCEKTSKVPKCSRIISEVEVRNFSWMRPRIPTEYFSLGSL